MSGYNPQQFTPTLNGFNGSVWDGDFVVVGSTSRQVALGVGFGGTVPFSVELQFSVDPGAFRIDLQTSDTDDDRFYVTKEKYETGLNEFLHGRMEISQVVAKFARLKIMGLDNLSAAITATFKR